MKRFISDLKKYYKYIKYSAYSELKGEVANSYLSWIWWILDPLFFMLVYVFISQIVFSTTEQYFQVFVFIGLTCWNFFSKNVLTSIKLIQANKDIVTKVYLPKWVLLLIKMFNNFFKMAISLVLCFLFMLIYQVPFHPMLFWIFPILIVLFIVTFGCASILMHCGVFIEDLHNVTNIILRLTFYLSGIFYSIPNRITGLIGDILLNCNPLALIINSARNVMIYNKLPNLSVLGIWLLIGTILTLIGIKLIYRHENTYVKVIK